MNNGRRLVFLQNNQETKYFSYSLGLAVEGVIFFIILILIEIVFKYPKSYKGALCLFSNF